MSKVVKKTAPSSIEEAFTAARKQREAGTVATSAVTVDKPTVNAIRALVEFSCNVAHGCAEHGGDKRPSQNVQTVTNWLEKIGA